MGTPCRSIVSVKPFTERLEPLVHRIDIRGRPLFRDHALDDGILEESAQQDFHDCGDDQGVVMTYTLLVKVWESGGVMLIVTASELQEPMRGFVLYSSTYRRKRLSIRWVGHCIICWMK